MLKSANQMLKMIREACRISGSAVPFPPLSSDLWDSGAYCSPISCIHRRKAAYQQCSSRLLAGRLTHSASSPSHNGTCTSQQGTWHLWGNGKWPHCCPVSEPQWEALASPRLPPSFLATHPTVCGMDGFWSSVAVSYWSPLSRAACRLISLSGDKLLTRGDGSPTSVGKKLCLIPDCLPPWVISLQLGPFWSLLLAKDMRHSLCLISGSPC